MYWMTYRIHQSYREQLSTCFNRYPTMDCRLPTQIVAQLVFLIKTPVFLKKPHAKLPDELQYLLII